MHRLRHAWHAVGVLSSGWALVLMVVLCANQAVAATSGEIVVANAALADATTAPADRLPNQRIVVHRNAGSGADVLLSVGIPFAPGLLRDAHRLRILDDKGAEVAAAVQPTLSWSFKDGSIRAVRAQFHVHLSAPTQTFYFAFDKPRTRDLAGWPYVDDLVDGSQGFAVPAALATLTPAWLCASLIAGPQSPAASGEPYANYVATQFKWAAKLPAGDPTAWLFDRPTTLYKAYIRSGRFDYLQAADLSYRFYMKYIRRDGLAMSPLCAGGWTYGDKPCDVKYVYVEPILLSLALTGDDADHDAGVVDDMMTLWENGGWNNKPGPYSSPSEYFTERLAGLGLIETVSAYELTGKNRYLSRIKDRVDWLYQHQRNNPDRLGDDGSWRNSWNLHENDSWNPATDVRGSSPWMTENIIDGLWHAWLVTGDPRIPGMITGFGRYMERYGWISPNLLVHPHDWRNPCSGSDGLIAWYWSSAQASGPVLAKIEESDGWYSDAHDVELGLPVAAAYYFENDPAQSALLKRRLASLTSSYNIACGNISDTLRRFNWNNRGSGVAQWMMHQPPGAGALQTAVKSADSAEATSP